MAPDTRHHPSSAPPGEGKIITGLWGFNQKSLFDPFLLSRGTGLCKNAISCSFMFFIHSTNIYFDLLVARLVAGQQEPLDTCPEVPPTEEKVAN